jgi:hypothetical protein
MQIYLLKKTKDLGTFRFMIFVLPAAPAAATAMVESATAIVVKAAATVCVTSTATTIARKCVVHYYRAYSEQQYRSYDTSDAKYCCYPRIHYTIRPYYPFIGSHISLHKLYVQTNYVWRTHFRKHNDQEALLCVFSIIHLC